MEKMIGVINNSLRNVINGIKTHRADAEKNLAVIKADMDDKVLIAAQYKVNVEDARTIIAGLENEISDLENDLKHLNETFGSKNFTEILSAGNKEINTKIIEKRAVISQQNQRILYLTEKAHVLKEDLIKLKQRKAGLEDSLNKSVSLERYYELRINDIINYSEEHPSELDKFELTPQEEVKDVLFIQVTTDGDNKAIVQMSVGPNGSGVLYEKYCSYEEAEVIFINFIKDKRTPSTITFKQVEFL